MNKRFYHLLTAGLIIVILASAGNQYYEFRLNQRYEKAVDSFTQFLDQTKKDIRDELKASGVTE